MHILITGGAGFIGSHLVARHLANGDQVYVFKMNIYIGNLVRDVTDEDIKTAISPFGEITSVNIIKDKFSGESKRFAFVEMKKKGEGEAAIRGLNGKELRGRPMTANEARPKSEGDRRPGQGRGGRCGGYGRRAY